MRLTVILAALCAVLFASSADARPKHTSPYGGEVGCSDPVMRPCDTGSEIPTFGKGISRKSLRHRHFLQDPTSKEITHHNTTLATRLHPGLA